MKRSPHVASKRAPLRATAAWCSALPLAALTACAQPERPRGLLLISVDSLRADHLGCYGYQSRTRPDVPTSPSIDRLLAEQGTLFERVFSTTSWTLPAHMAMLTGLANEEHGVRDLPDRLDPRHVLLAQTLRAEGWRTAGFWSGPNLHPYFGFDRGFERYVDCSSARAEDPSVFGVRDSGSQRAVRELNDASHRGLTGPAVIDAFGSWLEGLSGEEPFFAFVHLWDVHYDYEPPPEHDLFFPDYRGGVHGRNFRNLSLPQPVDPLDVARIVSLYDGEIHFTDANVARLLALVDARGWLQDTLVALTADHGEEFYEHTRFGHRNTLFDEVLRVPLILRWPGHVPAGLRVREPASLIDVAPTLLELCGLEDSRQARAAFGRSLVPALGGATSEPRALPIELTVRLVDLEMRGARGPDWKVVREKPQGRLWLYDFQRDRAEHTRQSEAELVGEGQSESRFERTRALWATIDARVLSDLDRSGSLPEGLSEELGKFGYTYSAEELGAEADAERGE